MRQRFFFAGLLCALLLNGWGGALAAVKCCPHASNNGAASAVEDAGSPAEMNEAHACCRQRQLKAEADGCPMSKQHAGETPAPRQHHAAPKQSIGDAVARGVQTLNAERNANVEQAATLQPANLCAHCMGRNETPPASSIIRAQHDAGRDSSLIPSRASGPNALPPLASFGKIIYPEHSPPAHTRRHVLFSIFLI